jgi:hypothetical protein
MTEMNEMPGGSEAPKKNNTPLIIGIVVAVLLCCCCAAVGAGVWLWNNGDALLGSAMNIVANFA